MTLQKSARLVLIVSASAATIFSTSCKAPLVIDQEPIPRMPESAKQEIRDRCGETMDGVFEPFAHCPVLEAWLAEVQVRR